MFGLLFDFSGGTKVDNASIFFSVFDKPKICSVTFAEYAWPPVLLAGVDFVVNKLILLLIKLSLRYLELIFCNKKGLT